MDRARYFRICSCFDQFRPCGPALIARVRIELARRHPSIHSLFPEDQDGRLNARVFLALDQLVRGLNAFGKVEERLLWLGALARDRGLKPAHYPVLRQTLVATMAELAGPDWSPTLHQDWEFVLTGVCGGLLRGGMSSPGVAAAAPARMAA